MADILQTIERYRALGIDQQRDYKKFYLYSIFPNVMTRLHNANLQAEIEAYIASQETDVPQGVLQGVADDLTDRQRVILEILKNVAVNVAVNTKYLSERLGVNRKTIQQDAVAL